MARSPAVVVVAYRADDELCGCLRNLAATTTDDDCVVVVDNGSSPVTAAIVAAAGAHYLDAGGNRGYAAGVNLGLDVIDSGRDVLLLNPDAQLSWPDVGTLQDGLHRSGERRAAVGPALRRPDGTREPASWPLPSPAQSWVDALALSSWWRGPRFVTGAVLLLSGAAIADVGRFDERYFLYAEEADWQQRALRRGWSVAVVDDVVAVHRGAASSGDPVERERRFHASAALFAHTWYGGWRWWLMRAGTVVGAVRRSVFGRSAAQRAENRRLVRSILRRGC